MTHDGHAVHADTSRADRKHADFDLTDAELRASRAMKWSAVPDDVIPAWVAEMDVRPCPPVALALHRAVEAGCLGYPTPSITSGLPEATAHLMTERYGLEVDPAHVIPVGDVMGGVTLALNALCASGPVVVPVPTYPPFLDVVPFTGRRAVLVPCLSRHGRFALDVDRIDAELAAGARTVLLANPANPLGRVWSVAELTDLRDVVVARGARVISDEIHGPLVLEGTHVPYASLPGTGDHVTTVVSATKAWNFPGLKCAQLMITDDADRDALAQLPNIANHGLSSLGVIATVAAYREGGDWLDGVLAHLLGARRRFGELLAERLPDVAWAPMEATYLAWLDLGAMSGSPAFTRGEDPTRLALDLGRVLVSPGVGYGPGYGHCVRVNIATSLPRLEQIVDRLAASWRATALPFG